MPKIKENLFSAQGLPEEILKLNKTNLKKLNPFMNVLNNKVFLTDPRVKKRVCSKCNLERSVNIFPVKVNNFRKIYRSTVCNYCN